MMRIWKAALFLMFVFVFAGVLGAQIPNTPVGRQFLAWQKAQDSGDRAVIQEFINKSMSFGRVDQELAIHNQSGGYEVKRVLESDDTHLVVLAQERGATRQFVRITFNVASSEPYAVAGIGIQNTEPPPDLAPPKMTESEAAAARKGAPFLQFSAWLDVFNSGDRARMQQFLADNAPSLNLDGQMNFRERTGGFELRGLEQATPTSLTGLVQERTSDQFGRFVVVVDAAEPHRITRFGVNAIPRPADFPMPKMSEAELINALRTKLQSDASADRFSGTVL